MIQRPRVLIQVTNINEYNRTNSQNQLQEGQASKVSLHVSDSFFYELLCLPSRLCSIFFSLTLETKECIFQNSLVNSGHSAGQPQCAHTLLAPSCFIYAYGSLACMYVYASHACSAHACHKKALDSLELDLHMVVNCHVGG